MEHDGVYGEVFNIGSQDEVEILALAEKVREATGSSSEIKLVPYDEAYEEGFEDMQRRIPDTTRIRERIGWEPTKSLDEILADVVERASVVVGQLYAVVRGRKPLGWLRSVVLEASSYEARSPGERASGPSQRAREPDPVAGGDLRSRRGPPGIAPVEVAITGSPAAIASTSTMPNCSSENQVGMLPSTRQEAAHRPTASRRTAPRGGTPPGRRARARPRGA